MRVVLIGGGGHASDVLDAIEAYNLVAGAAPGAEIKVVGLVADGKVDMRRFEGRGVKQIGGIEDVDTLAAEHYVACVGYPQGRRAVVSRVRKDCRSICHPAATISEHATLLFGVVVLANAAISARAFIGRHVMIGAGAIVGHDTVIGDFSSIMPGAVVSGDVKIGPDCLVGANATILEGLSIGEGARIGAGAVVTKDVPPGVTAKGVPARYISP